MTPSPDALDDVELSEILSSTTGSPGVAHSTEDFTIDLGGILNSVFLYIFASTVLLLLKVASCKGKYIHGGISCRRAGNLGRPNVWDG